MVTENQQQRSWPSAFSGPPSRGVNLKIGFINSWLVYLLTCLAALGLGCGMQDLPLWPVGASSLTRVQTLALCFGEQSLSLWPSREVPKSGFWWMKFYFTNQFGHVSLECSVFRILKCVYFKLLIKANIVLYFEEFISFSSSSGWPHSLSLCVLAAGGSHAAYNMTLSVFSDLWRKRKFPNLSCGSGAGKKPTSCLSAQAGVCYGEFGAAAGDLKVMGQRPTSSKLSKVFPPDHRIPPLSQSKSLTTTLPSCLLATTLLCMRISQGDW